MITHVTNICFILSLAITPLSLSTKSPLPETETTAKENVSTEERRVSTEILDSLHSQAARIGKLETQVELNKLLLGILALISPLIAAFLVERFKQKLQREVEAMKASFPDTIRICGELWNLIDRMSRLCKKYNRDKDEKVRTELVIKSDELDEFLTTNLVFIGRDVHELADRFGDECEKFIRDGKDTVAIFRTKDNLVQKLRKQIRSPS